MLSARPARRLASVFLLALLAGCSAVPRTALESAAEAIDPGAVAGAGSGAALADDEDGDGHGGWHTALLYIPNRVFDLLDVVRLRLRVGPGLQFSVRATELADFRVGTYATIFLGIPGPRREPDINWPFGMENSAGAELSIVELNADPSGPTYGLCEFGLGFQAFLIGLDAGVDPWEALDFLTGLVTWDIEGDDL
jgi:hypothetical protein